MTDEELGRAWAKANGKRPYQTEWDHFGWQSEKWTSVPCHSLPPFLHHLAAGHFREEDAYGELGRAIRVVLSFADGVRCQLGVTA